MHPEIGSSYENIVQPFDVLIWLLCIIQRIKSEGLDDKCTMISGNALEQDYSTATVFYLYLIPRGLRIILPVLKALGKPLRVITYMSPFPESETPIETFQVTSAKHPDAQWPLFLYDITPSSVKTESQGKDEEGSILEGQESNSLSTTETTTQSDNVESSHASDTVFDAAN